MVIAATDVVTPAVIRVAAAPRMPVLRVGGIRLATVVGAEEDLEVEIVDDVVRLSDVSRGSRRPYVETNWPHAATVAILMWYGSPFDPRGWDPARVTGARVEQDADGIPVIRWPGGLWLRAHRGSLDSALRIGELAQHTDDALADSILSEGGGRLLILRRDSKLPPVPTESYAAWREWADTTRRRGR